MNMGTVQSINSFLCSDCTEVLKTLDETVIRPNFELPSQDKVNDLDEFIETIDDLNNTTTNE